MNSKGDGGMKLLTFIVSLLLALTTAFCHADDLGEKLKKDLPQFGHRNWIVIADSAYPAQSRPGIETIYLGGDQLQAVEQVLAAIEASKHVRANVYIDAELKAVPE